MGDQDFNIKVVTTADTSGIKQTSDELERLRAKALREDKPPPLPPFTDPATRPGLAGVAIAAGAAFTAASIAAREVYAAVKESSEEIAKISKEVGQQVLELDKAQIKWQDIARTARSEADVSRVAVATLPILDAIATKTRQISSEQITFRQNVIESLLALDRLSKFQLPNWHPFTEGLRAAQSEQEKLVQLSQATAEAAVTAARRSQTEWERVRLQPTVESYKELVNSIQAYINYQNSIDLTPGPGFEARLTDYKLIGERIADIQNQLQGLNQIVEEGDEFRKDLFPSVNTNLNKIQELREALQAMGVQTQNLNTAFDQGMRTTGPAGERIRSMVIDLQKAQNAASAGLQSDMFKGPATFQNEALKRQSEFAARIAAQRELAAEGQGEEVTRSEQIKFNKEEELRMLQRQQALQRSLLPEGAGQAEELKTLGKEGIKNLEARAARIKELQGEMGQGPQAKRGDIGDVVNWLQKIYQVWQ